MFSDICFWYSVAFIPIFVILSIGIEVLKWRVLAYVFIIIALVWCADIIYLGWSYVSLTTLRFY